MHILVYKQDLSQLWEICKKRGLSVEKKTFGPMLKCIVDQDVQAVGKKIKEVLHLDYLPKSKEDMQILLQICR